jgi:hypothetical protein
MILVQRDQPQEDACGESGHWRERRVRLLGSPPDRPITPPIAS